jgi:uncharacterized protein (TIGR03435 family)
MGLWMTKRFQVVVVSLMFAGSALHCQDTQPAKVSAFEVATIRPADPNVGGRLGFLSQPGGRVEIGFATVKMLAYYAFDVPERYVVGGPDWVKTDRFNILAVPPDGAESRRAKQAPLKATPSDEQRKMIESLLLERFGFKFHREMKEMPVYLLERGSGKLGLEPPKDPDADPRGGIAVRGNIVSGEANGNNMTMVFLARQLGNWMDRPVLDRTGIAGQYDFHLDPVDPENTDYQVAAFGAMERLGLKLRAGKGMVETIVIDSVEKPSAN